MTAAAGSRLSAFRLASDSRWFVPAVLALPFVVGVAALRGLTAALPIFHASDEQVYQYPTVLQFGRQLPFPDLGHYKAAQTPLFHLLLAVAGKLIGYELWRLRLVEVLISYGLALALFGLFDRRLGLGRGQSLALTLLFVLSPYVYGTSFRLMTDNLALLFAVLAIDRLERFRETDRIGPFAVACGWIAAGILTRQSTAFMLGVAGLYAMRGRLSARGRALAVTAVGLAAVPAAALFVNWHGFVPPGGDPSSCGLCPAGRAGAGAGAGELTTSTLELALATIGLYGAVLFGLPLLTQVPRRWRSLVDAARGPLIGAAAGAALLLLRPADPGDHPAGLIWNAGQRFPAVHGTSLLFWVLVPLSGAVLWARNRYPPRRWLAVVFLGCFLLGTLAIRYPWQKYVDPYALLILLFTVRRAELATPRALTGAGVLALAFVAYTLSFVL